MGGGNGQHGGWGGQLGQSSVRCVINCGRVQQPLVEVLGESVDACAPFTLGSPYGQMTLLLPAPDSAYITTEMGSNIFPALQYIVLWS